MMIKEILFAAIPLGVIIVLFLPIPKKYFSWRFLWKPTAVVGLLVTAFYAFVILTEKRSLTQKIGDQLMDIPEFKERIGKIRGYGANIRDSDLREIPAISEMGLYGYDSLYQLEVELDIFNGEIVLIDYHIINVWVREGVKDQPSWFDKITQSQDVRWAVFVAIIGALVILFTRRYFVPNLDSWRIVVMVVMLFMSAWMIVQELFYEKSFMEKIQDQLVAKPELKRRMGRVKTSSMHLSTEPLPHTTNMQIYTSDSAYFFELRLDSIDGDIRLLDYKLNEVNPVEP